ncbi:hypothetical protein LAJ19_01325 [Deinococcus taeanensis]|uniref:hypothetical protein n=1 Tax=Deinococcus taeanensis TaxID=2737050 RepID=UPI001CDC9327|nr:hypothetical protein [Deinococcus taeanensis]UBV42899.1 hypothetical protein LAJ19_01325 [Deinococcus taeanensis]
MRRTLWLLVLTLSAALAQPAPLPRPPAAGPLIRPGQVWTLRGTTADGEQFQSTLRLSAGVPTTPGTYRADRGVLLLDEQAATLIALDLKDARNGGVGLACAVTLTPTAPALRGVLAAGPLADLPGRLEAALAVLSVTHTPDEQAQAIRELKLGTCTLHLNP